MSDQPSSFTPNSEGLIAELRGAAERNHSIGRDSTAEILERAAAALETQCKLLADGIRMGLVKNEVLVSEIDPRMVEDAMRWRAYQMERASLPSAGLPKNLGEALEAGGKIIGVSIREPSPTQPPQESDTARSETVAGSSSPAVAATSADVPYRATVKFDAETRIITGDVPAEHPDIARYRWLRRNCDHLWKIFFPDCGATLNDFDAAVDAAIKRGAT